MPRAYSDEELEAAIEALTERERFREAESVVTAAAPKLQRVLAEALEPGAGSARRTRASFARPRPRPTRRSG